MPSRDSIHLAIAQALINDGWEITDDPYVISYGERFLFVDLAAISTQPRIVSLFIGARRDDREIAVEIKAFRGRSAIADLEQAIGQYSLYRLLLEELDPDKELYLAVTIETFEELLSEPIGRLVVQKLPLKLIIVDTVAAEVIRWIS